LTTIFQCKNGHLIENPILKNIVKKICYESINAANTQGLNLSEQKTLNTTIDVIRKTSENHSSMLQSFQQGKKTEIESINGKMIKIGKIHDIDMLINEVLYRSIKNIR
jgi:2-dehydropantoate 2-reductase